MSATRIRAIFRKELREYRRSGSIVGAMAVLPAVFTIQPLAQLLALSAASAGTLAHRDPLLYMLGIPALVPALLAASAVVGERQQGTLEPVLTTPIRAEEFLVGKALAVLAPALAIAYTVFGLSIVAIELFAAPPVASAVLRAPELGRAGDLHAADRRLVDLGRRRDLDPLERRAGRRSAQRDGEPALGHRHDADRVRRHPRRPPPRARPRDRAAGGRRARLAADRADVRPRAADDGRRIRPRRRRRRRWPPA